MSDKFSKLFVSAGLFELHLYEEFGKGHGLFVKVNEAEVTLRISEDEYEDIFKQFKKELQGRGG